LLLLLEQNHKNKMMGLGDEKRFSLMKGKVKVPLALIFYEDRGAYYLLEVEEGNLQSMYIKTRSHHAAYQLIKLLIG